MFWLCSVALVIDNADLFLKLAPALRESSANVKFVVLLWGEKASVVSTNGSFLKDAPIHSFEEFVELGRASRQTSSGGYSLVQAFNCNRSGPSSNKYE